MRERVPTSNSTRSSSSLVDMTGDVGTPWRRRRAPCSRASDPRRAGHRRRPRHRRRPGADRGGRASTCCRSSSPSPATCGCWSRRCGWSPSSSGWATSSVHVAKIARLRVPEIAVPGLLVPTIARDGRDVAEDMIAEVAQIIANRDVLAAQALEDGRRGDGLAAPQHVPAQLLGDDWEQTASRRPSTSPCSAATTSGSPTTPSRSPAASSSSSPARTRQASRSGWLAVLPARLSCSLPGPWVWVVDHPNPGWTTQAWVVRHGFGWSTGQTRAGAGSGSGERGAGSGGRVAG